MYKPIIIALTLFLVGYALGPTALDLTEQFLGRQIQNPPYGSSPSPSLSLGLLLAFCVVCATAAQWCIARINLPLPSQLVFGIALLLSLLFAFAGIAARLNYLRDVYAIIHDSDRIVQIRHVNYFRLGLGGVLPLGGCVGSILLTANEARKAGRDEKTLTREFLLAIFGVIVPYLLVLFAYGIFREHFSGW